MSRSHYTRFKEGVQISGVSLNIHQKGRVFYVGNSSVPAPIGIGASNNNSGLSPDYPFSTLDYAVGVCVANRGDKIIVLPGHAETISNATDLAIDVAGIDIIGCGTGLLCPVFSFSATSSNVIMSASNCSLKNVVFKATIDSVVAGLTIQGANCEIDIETADTSSAIEFISPIVTTATADNLKLKWRHRGFAAGDACLRGLDLVGCQSAEIDVDFFGSASTAVINMRTTACDNIRVTGTFYNESVALTKNVVNSTTSTWSVKGHDAKGGNDFEGSDDLAVHYVGSDVASTALGTDGSTVTDSATTVLGAIGANNADNAFSSSSVVVNRDGSVLERLEDMEDLMVRSLVSAIKVVPQTVVSPGTTIFTVTGGPIHIISLEAEITTAIGATATTVQYATTDTVSSTTQTISAASADIQGKAAGIFITLDPVALSTAPVISAAGGAHLFNPAAGNAALGGIFMPAGTCGMITSASPSGNIKHRLTYRPLAPGVVVTMS